MKLLRLLRFAIFTAIRRALSRVSNLLRMVDAVGRKAGIVYLANFPEGGCRIWSGRAHHLEHDNKDRWCAVGGRCGCGGPHAWRREAGEDMFPANPPLPSLERP
jgi:hypothetical protein